MIRTIRNLLVILCLVGIIIPSVVIGTNHDLNTLQKIVNIIVYGFVVPGVLIAILAFALHLTTENKSNALIYRANRAAWLLGAIILAMVLVGKGVLGISISSFSPLSLGDSWVLELFVSILFGLGFRWGAEILLGKLYICFFILLLVAGGLSVFFLYLTSDLFKPSGLFVIFGLIIGALLFEMLQSKLIPNK